MAGKVISVQNLVACSVRTWQTVLRTRQMMKTCLVEFHGEAKTLLGFCGDLFELIICGSGQLQLKNLL